MRKPSPRRLLLLVLTVLPWPIRAALYRRVMGWEIHPSARIGYSLIDARIVRLGPRSRIGHLTVIRNLSSLELGEESSIGNWNWISAAEMFTDFDASAGTANFRGLVIDRESAITSRHYVDCSGGVAIGQFTTIGGVRSTILTHSIDMRAGTQTTSAVTIGDRCFVSSNVSVVPGSVIPRGCVVAMGSVVVGHLDVEGALYAGVPAKVVRMSIDDGAYFTRKRGFVGLRADADDSQDEEEL